MAIQLNNKTSAKPALDIGQRELLPKLSRRGKISSQDRKFFTEQLALLLETGNSLQPSLQALKSQMTKPAMIELLDQLMDDIEQGLQFSTALSRRPEVFSQTYINLIAASEEGGYMHEVLEQLLDMEQKREELQQIIFSALSYPVFLLLFALGVIVFILVVVFPKFADLFSDIADELPASTKFLMGASDVISQHWMTLGIGLALFFVAYHYWARTAAGIRQRDWAKLHWPLLNDVFPRIYLVNSLRVLSLSLGNGVNIIDSLHACRDVVNNRLYQQFIDDVEEHVERGEGMAGAFTESDFIPPLVAQMIKTGEDSANLPRVLQRVSEYYENELERKLRTLSKLAEPVMLLVMGAVVGIIVSSLILPIFKLSRAVA
ncbi:MAG: type II secretion system F family protein [Gammaproteobacteria bacterium]|nr:type II secretion system F family protein [Gammaproteobacteria bacterium]